MVLPINAVSHSHYYSPFRFSWKRLWVIHYQYFFVFPLRKGVLGNTILNREVREDITIKSKALQATLGKSKEKSKCQSPEVAANVLERKKSGGHYGQNRVRTQETSHRWYQRDAQIEQSLVRLTDPSEMGAVERIWAEE